MSSELIKKTDKELEKMLTEKREKSRDFRFSANGTRVKNIKDGSSLKKEIAQILTEIRAREIKTN